MLPKSKKLPNDQQIRNHRSLGTGPEKKAKIFLQDYQGDLYKLYVTFHCGSEFRTFEPVSCTGIEKIGIFSEKIP